MAVKFNLKILKNQIKKGIDSAKDEKELNDILKEYMGKKGHLTLILRSLERLPKAKRAKIGKEANELKNYFRVQFEEKAGKVKEKMHNEADAKEWIDITVPGKKPALGHLNPLTLAKMEVEEIFQSMGFSVVQGPDIETEWYNFDALNIPKDHPARDQWDTFWLKTDNNPQLLLRTHTSPVQARYMEKNNPPLRIIVPGDVFRHEATDASHEFQLYQVEGLMVDKGISAANFKAIVEEFFKRFFKKETKIRLRPDFFPFTEPSFDVSISCLVCGGKGCPVCKQTGWVEVAGAGMVHPNVFKNSGLNPKEWQGWAFGFGLERLTMMKYKIDDIRLFRSGDLRFLNQF
ncbi:MAG: phenylalanine--tRNA ligase subunit alpha [Patescibacteria group bacterium]